MIQPSFSDKSILLVGNSKWLPCLIKQQKRIKNFLRLECKPWFYVSADLQLLHIFTLFFAILIYITLQGPFKMRLFDKKVCNMLFWRKKVTNKLNRMCTWVIMQFENCVYHTARIHLKCIAHKCQIVAD